MERPLAAPAVERAPRGLAVDRHHLRARVRHDARGECGDEAGKAGLEPGRIEQPEQAREGVVARYAARQREKAPQKRLLGTAEQGHVDAALGAAQGRRERDQQDLQQVVTLGIARPRVR